MDPQSKHILFYSNNCPHSREFINQLYKNQPLYSKFIKVDVQTAKVNIPKCVNAVPAIIIKTPRMKPQVYVGDEVFVWYNQFLSRIEKASSAPTKTKMGSTLGNGSHSTSGGILDYDPCTMSGFSDNFSLLGENTSQSDPIAHQFEFLSEHNSNVGDFDPNKTPTFSDTSSKNNDSDKNEKKSQLESALERLNAQRALDVPAPPQRKGGGGGPI